MPDFVVTETPRRHSRTLLQADGLALALDFVERHVGSPSTRLVLWWPDVPSDPGPDVMVAVPLRLYQKVETLADELVEAWDRSWLLIDSTPASQREAVRGDLVGAVVIAMISAAVTGLDEAGDHVGI
ncbi:hypothetical protein [Lichenibacterium ramalinae]|uniref:Uncharacterized protein n=1 Tax=Lichenibacterium ramalinae TaxID=2316527 RepID=A0A4Q2R6C5_9HYPH|nr:hypothetical protein [Lichenibacterium ramalinae]RYB02126.1 hypothetical protein D3272_22660 [Lichenibacterium ramalinae]